MSQYYRLIGAHCDLDMARKARCGFYSPVYMMGLGAFVPASEDGQTVTSMEFLGTLDDVLGETPFVSRMLHADHLPFGQPSENAVIVRLISNQSGAEDEVSSRGLTPLIGQPLPYAFRFIGSEEDCLFVGTRDELVQAIPAWMASFELHGGAKTLAWLDALCFISAPADVIKAEVDRIATAMEDPVCAASWKNYQLRKLAEAGKV